MNHKATSCLASALACATLFTLATSAARAQTYTVHELPIALTSGDEAYAAAIDAKGTVLVQVIGAWIHTDSCKDKKCRYVAGGQHMAINKAGSTAGSSRYGGTSWAIRQQGGAFQLLVEGSAYGINAQGVTVGKTSGQKPFSFDDSLTVLSPLEGTRGAAKGINDAGLIVGHTYLLNGGFRATMWKSSLPHDLGALVGGSESHAHAVNKHGDAVGCSNSATNANLRAVRYSGGEVIEYQGGSSSCAYAINRAGVAVGDMTPEGSLEGQAFVAEGNQLAVLADRIPEGDRSKYQLMWASGINDTGQIAVTATRLSDAYIVALRLDPIR